MENLNDLLSLSDFQDLEISDRKTTLSKSLIVYVIDFQAFPSYGTHKLITKILRHIKNMLLKNKYNFDSFTLDGYFCARLLSFFHLTAKER